MEAVGDKFTAIFPAGRNNGASSVPVMKETDPILQTQQQDSLWMQRIATGDMDAFECLVNEHKGRVVGTVARMLGDTTEAEDIAQEVFLRVWSSAKRYQPQAKFTTWLMTITRNLVFNELRRRRRKPVASMEAEFEDRPPPQFVDKAAITPADGALHAELEVVIQNAIEELPENQRIALVLRRYQELPYEEIATILGTTVASVKSLLFRARAELKLKLSDYLG